MALRGIHLLLTYRCERECDHCFVWSGPGAEGTMTLGLVRRVLEEARRLGTVEIVYFEGGEPFLYYALLVEGMRLAAEAGFDTGVVSNAYWAIGDEEAEAALRPLQGKRLVDLSLSTDLFHDGAPLAPRTSPAHRAAGADSPPANPSDADGAPESAAYRRARDAAGRLGLPVCGISVAPACPGMPADSGELRFRGRAVEKLAADLPRQPWAVWDECGHEELADPGRVHIDPYGNVHLCQGLLMGNVLERPLDALVAAYDPAAHPIVGPLLEGGPAALVRRYDLPCEEGYVEACHLCYRAREALRERFPACLGPGQVYGQPADP